MAGRPTHVLVTGIPGSGKTTLANELAPALGLALLAKDHLKEVLFDSLGVGDIAWSRRLGRAAISLQLALLSRSPGALVECAFHPGVAEPELLALDADFVQVHCSCPFELARDRYFRRWAAGERHPGHREDLLGAEHYEALRPLTAPLDLPGPLLQVDTSAPVDLPAVVAWVADALHR